MKLIKLDRTGHSTFVGDAARVEIEKLGTLGYAFFREDSKIAPEALLKTAPVIGDDVEVLALAPLVGG